MPSTAIRCFDYDAAQAALDVTFVTGRRYRYFRVPPRIYDGFRAASSKGRYFNARVRDRFAYRELPRESQHQVPR